jgi:hypothetical protein
MWPTANRLLDLDLGLLLVSKPNYSAPATRGLQLRIEISDDTETIRLPKVLG